MRWTTAEGHDLTDVLMALARNREVYALYRADDGQYRYERTKGWNPQRHTLGAYRPVEPLKSVLFPPREYLGGWGQVSRLGSVPERIVFGVKNCDLASLKIHDHVFLGGEFTDPHYAEARERTILVCVDCTGFLEVCFCPVVGEQPYPIEGFDINVAPTPKGPVLEAGTSRGADLLEALAQFLRPADDTLLEARETERATVHGKLVEHAASACGLSPGLDFKLAVEQSFESSLWEDFAADCVECGACNFICCTCHCFMLCDGIDGRGCPARTKQWDSCLFPHFATTAGGDPRPRRAQRLRNRFDKKFIYFPQELGKYACDGCGRCTEACIGKIDIRQVLKRAADESVALHAHTGND